MSECLSFGDSLFLYLERPGTPLHVASVCIFDGTIALDACIQHIESKLPLIPRYWQRVIPAPFRIGFPSWQYDDRFNIGNHVREIRLKRGTDTELRRIASAILSHPLDRQKPLWDFTIIAGLRGERTAVLARVHHCLADGISGIGLLNAIMDSSPTPQKTAVPKRTEPRPVVRDQASALLNSIVNSWFSGLDRILKVESRLLQMAQALAAPASASMTAGSAGDIALNAEGDEISAFLPEFGAATERLPFNVVCQGPQKFEWTELPFADIRDIKKRCGTTVNDVLLTVMTAAIRKYARAHKVPTSKRAVRIVVPVNVRTSENANGLGNQITFLPVTAPLDVEDPRKLLAAVHRRTEVLKKIGLAEIVGLAGTLMGTIPTVFQMFGATVLSQLPISLCNTICTNVPGPTNSLYLLGHKMQAMYPYVPIGGEMGMNCAIVTYDGKAFFGFTGDAKAIPDLKRLPVLVQESFEELREAVRCGEGQQKRAIKKRKSAAPPAKEPAAVIQSMIEQRPETRQQESPLAMAVGA